MLNSAGLGFTFSARDLASSVISRLERAFGSLDDRVGLGSSSMVKSLKLLGVGLGVFTAGAVAVVGSFGLASMAGAFEQAVAAVGAISGASAKELEQLREAALDAGIATQFSPTQATVGLRELAAAGFNATESIKLLIPVLDLAGGSLGDLTPEAAAGLAAQAMKAFGLEVGQASLAVDQMLQASNLFALRASDLPLALGTAARGAGVLHQSLEETLVSLGLVKNIIPSVERSATAVAVAMERMVKPQTQAALKGLGVAVVDAKGHFRPFLDVLGEMAPALDKMTEAQRSAFLLKTFGGEALGGINAILTQVTNGIRTQSGETLKGGEALKYLRDQMAQAGGTAATFRDKMLDTFAGQKQLMRGSLETLAIVLGQPFAQVLKPVLGSAVDALNVVLKVIRATPMSVKRAFGSFVFGAGLVTMLIGAVVTGVTALVLFASALKVVAAAFAVTLGMLLPATALVAVFGAVLAGLYIAVRDNLGGVGDLVRRVGAAIQLFFEGLQQLIEQGGWSGAVREELNKVENLGLKQFLITVWMVVYRVQRLWEGFSQGFTAAIQAAAPIFEELAAAVREFGDEIAEVVLGFGGGAAALPSERYRAFGAAVGEVVGKVVNALLVTTSLILRFSSGIVRGVRSVWDEIEPAFTAVGEALGEVADAFGRLFGLTTMGNSVAGGATSSWSRFGEIVGRGVGRALALFAETLAAVLEVVVFLVNAAAVLVDGLLELGAEIAGVGSTVATWFTEILPNAVSSALATVRSLFEPLLPFFAAVGARVSAVFRAVANSVRSFLEPVFAFFDSLGEKLMSSLTKVLDFVIKLVREVPAFLLPSGLAAIGALPLSTERQSQAAKDNTEETAARAAAASSAMPAAADAGAHADQAAVIQAALAAATAAQPPMAPITVTLQVDGETLARATQNAGRGNAARSFSSVPVY